MNILTGLLVFVSIWWVVIFCVLPWGNAPDATPQTGNAPSAPANARIVKKLLITTGITAVLWLVFYAVVETYGLDFETFSRMTAGVE